MSESLRQYLAVVIVGVVIGGSAFAILVVARLLQPASTYVRRGMVPRPITWLTRIARSRTLRVWSPDATIAASLAEHFVDRGSRRLTKLGLAPVENPGDADVVVLRPGQPVTPAMDRLVPAPYSVLRLDDPDDAQEFWKAASRLSQTIRFNGVSTVQPGDVTQRPGVSEGDGSTAKTDSAPC